MEKQMTQEKKVVKPYEEKDSSKKEQVAEMFDNISHKYDFLNHFLSLGIDKLWRKKAIRLLKKDQPKKILDIATGTGDFAIAAMKLKPEEVIGADISNGMLDHGRKKLRIKKIDHIVKFEYGDSEDLKYEDGYFDALTVGFGVRNYENLMNCLKEMNRVIKPGGKAAVLEFSKPKKFPMKQLFGFYSKTFIPFWGKLISKDKAAYSYLPESVAAFPEGQEFADILQEAGFKDVKLYPVSGGIATIYMAEK